MRLIFQPIVKNYLSDIFIKKDLTKFRVGIQVKYKWPKSHSKLRNKIKITKNGLMQENTIFPNFTIQQECTKIYLITDLGVRVF